MNQREISHSLQEQESIISSMLGFRLLCTQSQYSPLNEGCSKQCLPQSVLGMVPGSRTTAPLITIPPVDSSFGKSWSNTKQV